MLQMLGGNAESAADYTSAMGKEIRELTLTEDELVFTFTDDTKIKLWDAGQQCCEHRYMHSDDDLRAFIGAKLLTAEVKDAPDIEIGYDVHEVAFLVVGTSLGVFTVETHNEHNGYYGGFAVCCAAIS